MRFTKDEFIEAIETLKEMIEKENKICEVFECGFEWVGDKWISEYYHLISKMCELEEDPLFGTDLDYFCWELDFGRKWEEGIIKDEDGNDIRLKTSEDLWNYIMGEGAN